MLTHQLYQQGERSQKLIDEMLRVEGSHKKMTQQAKRNNKKLQNNILSLKEKTVKGSTADKEEREALEKVKIHDNTDSKTDLFLLSRQIDALCSTMAEFDSSLSMVEGK